MSDRSVKSLPDPEENLVAVPTSADVARRANVSRATVSYVLNDVSTQKISEKTRKSVLRAARELGYRPNLAAQSLAAGASKIAIFVVPSVHLGELVVVSASHMTARAAEQGVTLIVHFEGPASRTLIDVARDLRPRVVISMFDLDDDTIEWLRDREIAVASVFGTGQTMIGRDRSGWLQVQHLAGVGHTKIAFADTTDGGLHLLANMRYEGVADACRERELPTPPRGSFDLDGEGAEQTVRSWAESGVTAVAAYNDEVAIAVLAGIRRAGLRCPQDLAVIGVDETAINGAMEPPLSSIAFDLDAMASLYADALSEMLGGNPAPQPTISTEDFMRVVQRESTRASDRTE
ncbi:LacI family DNA-binding transcriptional regulator [Diaminobutyricibacter sp. McL0618]|uniref:LacI family DNA-binding transcriptional regulator n=1 Tax=Leifsonia sp. McL0618 TaxID=3415677 RepID=UPI003CF51FB6